MSISLQIPSPLQQLKSEFLSKYEVELWIKRDDLIHPIISGNKWRKLEANITKAKESELPILTFGGAYSNHIAATAWACKIFGGASIGVIRGDEFSELNSTLLAAKKNGMKIHFVSREEYRKKEIKEYQLELEKLFGKFHLVPEGGANKLGVVGSRNIRLEVEQNFDVTCCAAGTGTTAAGILSALPKNEKLEVYPALKGGEYLEDEILKLMALENSSIGLFKQKKAQLEIVTEYHFGGFAKLKSKKDLVDFANQFYDEFHIPLDLIYNGKMLFGIMDRIGNGVYKKGSKLLVVHCGGLQGNEGMKNRFGVELAY